MDKVPLLINRLCHLVTSQFGFYFTTTEAENTGFVMAYGHSKMLKLMTQVLNKSVN